jgi:hypothetical protein
MKTTETITVQSIAKITGLVTSMEVNPKRLKEAKGCHSNIPAPGAGNGHSLSPNLQVTSLKETPLFQIIELPEYPLDKETQNIFRIFIISFFIGSVLAVSYFLLYRYIKNILS